VETIPISIATALVRAQRAAKPVAKTSENSFHRYAYASAESLITEARAALGEACLAVIPHGETISPGRGEADPDTLWSSYALCHEDGSSWVCPSIPTPIIPEKARPEDKAVATARTYALGYFLRGLLLLPRVAKGEEVDTRNDAEHTPAKVVRRERAVAAGVGAPMKELLRGAMVAAGLKGADLPALLLERGVSLAGMSDEDARWLLDKIEGMARAGGAP
jgi:hypothetical protein